MENSRDTAVLAIPGQMRSGRVLPSRRAQWHKRRGTMQWWYTAKAFMFKSIFYVAKGESGQRICLLLPGQSPQFSVSKASQEKSYACELVTIICSWLLAQLCLQRFNQQNNNPSPFPQAMKFLSSISPASLTRPSTHGRAKQLLWPTV